VRIRKATIKDLAPLTQLLIKFNERLTKYKPRDLKVFRRKEKSLNAIRESVKKEIKNKKGLFLVAEDKNNLVGFVFGTLQENNHMVFKTVKYGMLSHLWVKENYRGKGLATQFKKTLSVWFKKNNCKYIKLSVPDTDPAKRLYKKWGFEVLSDLMIDGI